jgi:hypothetical protein
MSGSNSRRRNWTVSITGALLVAIIAALIGFMKDDTSTATDRYYLRNTAGNVLFDHGRHSEDADACAACHHSLFGAEVAIGCEECHDSFAVEDFEHGELSEFHGWDCATCHEQAEDDDQAASCRSCHPANQQSESRLIDCEECHDEGYEADMMTHDEYLEIDDHSCLGCHVPGSIAEVYHQSCTPCHLEAAYERFTRADGSVNCGGCHLR